MKWFKHDVDAHRDTKLRKLIMAYGLEGYGLYFYCLEEIANAVTQNKYTFELEHDAEVLSFDTGISQTKIEEMMAHMIKLELFEQTDGIVTCLKLARRLDQSMTSNQEMRNIISMIKSHDGVMIPSDGVMTESRTDKNRREEKDIGRFTPPTPKEVDDYLKDKGYMVNFDGEGFCAFYQTTGWKLARGKSMKCWKSAITTWRKNDDSPVATQSMGSMICE